MSEIEIIQELKNHINNDDTLKDIKNDLHCITHVPDIAFRAWLFNYKNIPVVLTDQGNGHYSFYKRPTPEEVVDIMSEVISSKHNN